MEIVAGEQGLAPQQLLLSSNYFHTNLKTCINKFYGCIDLRVIFQSARRIKSFFSVQRYY